MNLDLIKNIKNPDDLKNIEIEKLPQVAEEIRDVIIDVVSKNGGHIAPGLGVVELTIALHYVFNCPKDKIVWDVGHQAYAHKILTGRLDKFDTLRQYKGISGFPNKDESEYDAFTVGHSSTAISQALGLVAARDLNKLDEKILAVVGDGSLGGGMAFEALNNAGQLKKDLIVVLNDNEMAISKNVGALAEYLNRIITKPIYQKVREDIRNILRKVPSGLGDRLVYTAEKVEESLKGLLVPGMLFEELGFFYIGPIDGHNTKDLINTFNNIKRIDGPVLVHVITKKGKGYKPAEEEPTHFHGTAPFNREDGSLTVPKNGKSFTNIFSDAIMEVSETNDKIIGITAAMPLGVGLDKFAEKYPDRFFDVGIAEQHAVSFASGLAVSGFKPVVAIYSTFLRRAYDQIIHDVCLQNIPVTFAIDRCGLVGEDGATHHGVFTVSYLRHIPNLIIGFPKDSFEMKQMFELAVKGDSSFAVCYPRAGVNDKYFTDIKNIPVEMGKAEEIIKGKDVVIFALGSLTKEALDAVNLLKEQHISAGLVNVRFIKPFDKDLLLKTVKSVKNIVIIEENVITGGLGSLVMEILEQNSVKGVNIKIIGLPDEFIEHGKRDKLFEQYGLKADAIAKQIKEFLK
jgi:1-deoxy-D-xylulose-5-phosphate synthase